MYIFVFFIIIVFGLKENIKNLDNITNPKKNLYALTKVPDEKFLNTNYIEFINFFRDISKEETCIQQFTDDNAFAYLIKKPTCTQFYVNAHIINGWTEDKFIKQLNDSKPKYIIYSSEINWFKKRNNAPKAEEFILNNYSFFKKIHSWEIYKLK